ncbi:MAG: HD domain-containing phosphohydrolase [Eubacteriales bacterium]
MLIFLMVAGNIIIGVFFDNYLRLEEGKQMRATVDTVEGYFQVKEMNYQGVLNDWAHWDDPFNYLNGTDPEFINMNLSNDTFRNLDTNIFIIIDKNGSVTDYKYYDLQNDAYAVFPEGVLTGIQAFMKTDGFNNESTYVLKIDGQFYMIAFSEITDQMKLNPANGIMIFGRLMDAVTLTDIEKQTGSGILITTENELDSDVVKGLSQKETSDGIIYFTKADETGKKIVNYLVIQKTADPESTVVLTVSKARDFYLAGVIQFRNLQMIYSLFILLISIFLFLLLRMFISNPAKKMTKTVLSIDLTKERLDKIEIKGKDELSILGSSINNMLSKIEVTQNEYKNSQERLIAAQQMAHVGSWELDPDTKKMWASEESYDIYGIEHISDYLPLESVQESVFPEYRALMDAAMSGLISKNEKYDVEYKIRKANSGEECFVHSKAVLIPGENGSTPKIVGTIQDITERKIKEEEIKFLSYHDQLTGLYNRRFYEEEIMRLDTKRNLPMTIIMGDVNGLKLINDSLGHAMGDELLKKTADAITQGCRADDIIARLGGDEFVVLLPRTTTIVAEQIIKRIQDLLSREKVGNIDISVSFGYEAKNNEEDKIQEVFKEAEDHMYKHKRVEGSSMRTRTVQIILNTLYEKSKIEQLHSIKVSEICEAIAIKLNLDKAEVYQIKIAGLMHDIGKIEIDETILSKPEKLNAEEWNVIRKHSEMGYQILSSVNEFAKIADYVLEHHERWDGKGYPNGLKGEAISTPARIIAIADAFDAMTRKRTYSPALSEEAAVTEIEKCAGTQFDPEIVRIFVEKVLGKAAD